MNAGGYSAIPQSDADHPLELRCPLCERSMSDALCTGCGFRMRDEEGIFCALPRDRQMYFSQFVADYQHIRREEGRNSQDQTFYLSLPHRDTTGRNSDQWKIRARSFEYLVNRLLKSLPNGARILDLGAGNCWLSYRLTLLGLHPTAVDLLTNRDDGMGAATHYISHLQELFPRFQAELHRLPFQNAQFDAAIFNASFHYSENYKEAVKEVFRCLRPNGMLIICDTPWYSNEASGQRMILERQSSFQERFHTSSNSVRCLEFLTDERLKVLEKEMEIQWTVHRPWYGLGWHLRPLSAWLRGRREPSKFRIYVAKKACCSD